MFFTADTHFAHRNIVRYCHRPFADSDEMDEVLISNWNEVVGRDDVVYHLGDFALGPVKKVREIIKRLNGKIYLCEGLAHDTSAKANGDLFEDIRDTFLIKPGGQQIFLSHYMHKVWPSSHYGTWHLFGHSHGRMDEYTKNEGKLLDVGVDTHDFYPWTFEEVVDVMKTRPVNFNELRRIEGLNFDTTLVKIVEKH